MARRVFASTDKGGEKKDAVPGGIDNEKARAAWGWESWRRRYGNISVDHPGVPVRNVFEGNRCCRCRNYFDPHGTPFAGFLDPKNGLLGAWRNNSNSSGAVQKTDGHDVQQAAGTALAG